MHETDFIEMLEPRLKRVRTGNASTELELVQEKEFFELRAEEAIELLRRCVVERGIEYCRHVGSRAAPIQMQQEEVKFKISPEDMMKYIYIDEESNINISILPTGEHNHAFILYNLDEISVYRNYFTCVPGCYCNPSISN